MFKLNLSVQKKEMMVSEMFSLARDLRNARPEIKIDEFQAKVLWNVVKSLEMKRRKGWLK
jgi:hypothetical protein